MKTDETLQENRQHSFLLIYILVLGLVVRIAAVMLGDFPLNDGGFFYSMSMDLLNNRFLLPVYTTYNQVSIPFAYPPFGLYLSALFLKIGIPITKTLQFVPALVSTVTIWAVYRLGFKMLNSRFQALLSAAVFASTPLAFIRRIFGGGITRSFGFLFLLLYLSALFSLFKNEGRRAGAVIWGSLTILSHPEAASNMVLAAIIFFLFL
ncbi:MAG: glycosyltransferase family 39 protein, partial [Chloroflexi bacterium]|nr:glycosyltransferase family 39 protein [Chloroflexota bacterium]